MWNSKAGSPRFTLRQPSQKGGDATDYRNGNINATNNPGSPSAIQRLFVKISQTRRSRWWVLILLLVVCFHGSMRMLSLLDPFVSQDLARTTQQQTTALSGETPPVVVSPQEQQHQQQEEWNRATRDITLQLDRLEQQLQKLNDKLSFTHDTPSLGMLATATLSSTTTAPWRQWEQPLKHTPNRSKYNITHWVNMRAWEVQQGIQRIYYINLDKNRRRRRQMELVLNDLNRPVPYERIPAQQGTLNGTECAVGKQDPRRCRGISGLVWTNLHIMETKNTSGGLTMVLEDDFVLGSNMTAIEQAIHMVPSDWDVIRLQAWHFCDRMLVPVRPKRFIARSTTDRIIPPIPGLPIFLADQRRNPRKNTTTVCCGTHAQIWRESSLYKLHRLWSRRPYQDIDCALSMDPTIKSYIIGRLKHGRSNFLGELQMPPHEGTDIPKYPDPNKTVE